MTLLVCHEVRRQVTLVELHSFSEIKLNTESIAFFHCHNAVFADLVDCVCNDLADACVCSRNCCNACDVALVVNIFCLALDGLNSSCNSLFDTALQTHWVCTGCDVAHALVNDCLCEHSCCCGSVTGDIICLGGDFLHELCAHVLEWIVEFDFLRDGNTVVSDGWCAELLIENDVASLRSERDLHCIGQLVHASLESATRLVIEFQLLCHVLTYLVTTARTSRLVRIKRSCPPCEISVPPYLLYKTTSPTLMSSAKC